MTEIEKKIREKYLPAAPPITKEEAARQLEYFDTLRNKLLKDAMQINKYVMPGLRKWNK